MKHLFAALSLCLLLSARTLHAELHPIKGPATGQIGDMAEIKIPEGYVYYPKEDMKEWMEMNHNLYSGDELGLLSNPDPQTGFVVLFTFDETGYIKDAEKEKLDADDMWKKMTENEGASNEERKKKGWAEMHMVNWAEKPQYNSQSQRLEWAVTLEEQNKQFINYNTRILGRKGVMNLIMAPHGNDWQTVVGSLNQSLDGFSYTSGNKYSEWKTGDKVAEFGLAALVIGGAGAFAAKSGLLGKLGGFFALLLAKMGKAVILVFVAIAGFFKKLFGGGNKEQ